MHGFTQNTSEATFMQYTKLQNTKHRKWMAMDVVVTMVSALLKSDILPAILLLADFSPSSNVNRKVWCTVKGIPDNATSL